MTEADPARADELADLVNRVYALAEADLWLPGKARTSADQMRERIENGEIAIATDGDRLLGCIRVYDVEPGVVQFGVLAVDPDERGNGVGNALIDFAERAARDRGAAVMRLEVLAPLTAAHAGKDALDRWYTRRGYRPAGSRPLDDPQLATPCEFVIYERPLSSTPHL